MQIKETKEEKEQKNKCKKCIWGKTLIDDKRYNIVNVMCMFPKCIKDKDKK